jgi:hypothetical protein
MSPLCCSDYKPVLLRLCFMFRLSSFLLACGYGGRKNQPHHRMKKQAEFMQPFQQCSKCTILNTVVTCVCVSCVEC